VRIDLVLKFLFCEEFCGVRERNRRKKILKEGKKIERLCLAVSEYLVKIGKIWAHFISDPIATDDLEFRLL
jgi:hypothetical protein